MFSRRRGRGKRNGGGRGVLWLCNTYPLCGGVYLGRPSSMCIAEQADFLQMIDQSANPQSMKEPLWDPPLKMPKKNHFVIQLFTTSSSSSAMAYPCQFYSFKRKLIIFDIYISNNFTIVLVMSMLIKSDFESCQNLKLSKFLHSALYILI